MQLKRLPTSALLPHPRYFLEYLVPGSYISRSGIGMAMALKQLNKGGKKYLLSLVGNHFMCLSTKEIGKGLPFPFPENTGKIIRVRKRRGYDGGQVGASWSRWRSDHDEVCCPSSPNQFLKISLHCQVPDSITSSSAALWPVSQAQLSSSLAFK